MGGEIQNLLFTFQARAKCWYDHFNWEKKLLQEITLYLIQEKLLLAKSFFYLNEHMIFVGTQTVSP